MSYPGRYNASITNRNSGGGNKKQGLAPQATHFFKAPFTGSQYQTDTYAGLGRFRLVCMNQLGGIGSRYNSQFAPTADGTQCPEDFTLQYIAEINFYLQNELSNLIIHLTDHHPDLSINLYNNVTNFELCYVGEIETFISDIDRSNNEISKAISNHVAHEISGKIFTHLVDNSYIHKIYFIDSSDGVGHHGYDLHLTNSIVEKINYVNDRVPENLIVANPPTQPIANHTLGIINNNFNLSGGTISGDPETLLKFDNYGIATLNNLDIYTLCCSGDCPPGAVPCA